MSDKTITAMNLGLSMTDEERRELEIALEKHEIKMIFLERRHGAIASIFTSLPIFLSEELVISIMHGVIGAAAYDTIKFAISKLMGCVKNFSFLTGDEKQIEATVSLDFKIGNAEIKAPIPENLSDEQFSAYMDMLSKTIEGMKDTQIPHLTMYESFVIDYTKEGESLRVLTMVQYAREQHKKQENVIDE